MHKKTTHNYPPPGGIIFNALTLSLLWSLFGFGVTVEASNLRGTSPEIDTAVYYKKINQLLEQSDHSLYQSPMLAFTSSVKAIYLAEQVPDSSYLITALNKGGMAAFYAGYIGEAATYFTRSVQLLKQKKPGKMLADTYNNLGAVYYHGKEEADSAIAYNNKAIMLFQELMNPLTDSIYNLEISQGYSNIGHILLGEQDYAQAEKYFKMSLDVELDTSVYQRGILTSLIGLSEIYLNSNRLEYSWELLDSAEEYAARWEDYTLLPAVDYARGQWCERKGDSNRAIDFYSASLQRSLADSTYTSIKELANALADIYQKEGQQERALYYLQLAMNAEQEIDKMSAVRELTKMEMQQQFSQWEVEIQQAVKTSQRKYLCISLVGVVIAIIAIWLLLIARKQKRRTQLRYLESKMHHEQITLEKAKLSQSMDDMEKKLAKQLLERMTRNELIEGTIKKLLELYRRPKLNSRQLLQDIANSLRDVQDHTIWEEFEFLYANSNSELFQKLNDIEGLTLNDRRLCIFLHMNMTSKEISALTGQSIKAIEVARTRLRKKLGLTNSNISLHDFLASLGEDALEEHTYTEAISKYKR